MRSVNKCLPLALAAGALVTCLAAARADMDANEPEPILDTEFLAQAITSGYGEVQLSELAAKQAGDNKVKAFAQKLVNDHAAMNDKLVDAGRGLKFGFDFELAKETRANYDRLSRLRGAEFDRKYLKQMIDNHEKAVTLFEREAKTGINADVKRFAGQNASKIKDHLKEAHDLLDGLRDKS